MSIFLGVYPPIHRLTDMYIPRFSNYTHTHANTHIIIIIIYSLRDFCIRLSWWSFTEVWVWTSLLSSPGLFSVCCLFSIMLECLHSPPTFRSSNPFNNPLITVTKAPVTIGIMVIFMFHRFFRFPSKVEVLILLFTFFQFYSVVSRDSKVHSFANSLLFFFCRLL